jgi:hypothetical protein
VEVQLRDGTTSRLDLKALLPPAPLDPPLQGGDAEREQLVGPSACRAENVREGSVSQGSSLQGHRLLRARVVHRPAPSGPASPCVLDAGGPVVLALHRSTAFGADGAHLLSALPASTPDPPRWTADLGPALGAFGAERYAVYAPDVRGDALCFWLVRAQRSLSEVCVARADGELRSARVVF